MTLTVPSNHSEVCVADYAYESTPDVPIWGGAIPVELVAFDAQVDGDNVRLN